eukprot:6481738-Amphidinium_carterae.2
MVGLQMFLVCRSHFASQKRNTTKVLKYQHGSRAAVLNRGVSWFDTAWILRRDHISYSQQTVPRRNRCDGFAGLHQRPTRWGLVVSLLLGAVTAAASSAQWQMQELQQQHLRVQQVLQSQTRDRPPLLVDTKGIGKPATFSGKEDEWREWSVKFESFVFGVRGEDMRAVLLWADEQETEADATNDSVHYEIRRPVWCHLPEGDAEPGKVARLLKSVYGLQEANHTSSD